MDMEYIIFDSPLGSLKISFQEEAVTAIVWLTEEEKNKEASQKESDQRKVRQNTKRVLEQERSTALVEKVREQLEEYFKGQRASFSVPYRFPAGTAFQQAVWRALLTIPYGETRSYQEIAIQIGSPKAVRAVGMANHNNPLALFIPCHRVIGKNGALTGYAGGLDRKKALLDLEKWGDICAWSK